MTELLTAAEMRSIEQAAIASGAVTGRELMERAGHCVVEAVFGDWPELAAAPHRAIVLCGPGNNGGDGFVVARLLKEWGWEVEAFLYGDPAKLPPDARRNFDHWQGLGPVGALPFATLPALRDEAGLIVDGLFGIGLSRGLGGELAQGVLMQLDRPEFLDCKRVAIDVPSGLCADSGHVLTDAHGHGPAFRADLTVTFHRPKPGHFLSAGPDHCGRVVTRDIGLPFSSLEKYSLPTLATRPDAGDLGKHGHKYDNGHALIVSGPPGTGGAARLAARGALRIGAGLVSVACDEAAVPEHAAQLTAVMIRRVNRAGELAALLEDPRLNAICIGPGLGLERARELVPVALGSHVGAEGARGAVLDADALTAFANAPEELFALLHDNCVLTPHGGEFRRLFPDIAAKLDSVPTQGPAFSNVDATREAAARAGCAVLFKGPDTVIADPDGRASINSAHYDRAAPWLATAGSGDVLAGFTAGLLARGFAPMQAAETAAWLHVECARHFGPGLIAEDIAEQLPAVFRRLGC
jgi:hydroxyethylthiazole kinase-like uncharacterized protein yjeF